MIEFDQRVVPERGIEHLVLPTASLKTLQDIISFEKARKVLFGHWVPLHPFPLSNFIYFLEYKKIGIRHQYTLWDCCTVSWASWWNRQAISCRSLRHYFLLPPLLLQNKRLGYELGKVIKFVGGEVKSVTALFKEAAQMDAVVVCVFRYFSFLY